MVAAPAKTGVFITWLMPSGAEGIIGPRRGSGARAAGVCLTGLRRGAGGPAERVDRSEAAGMEGSLRRQC